MFDIYVAPFIPNDPEALCKLKLIHRSITSAILICTYLWGETQQLFSQHTATLYRTSGQGVKNTLPIQTTEGTEISRMQLMELDCKLPVPTQYPFLSQSEMLINLTFNNAPAALSEL